MDALATQLEQYNRELDKFILPSTLMDCFEYHRRREMRKACAAFNGNELSWFLHMMNELRGVADRKDDFDLLFDPVMYMVDHPAWTAPPGVVVEMPPLNTEVLETAGPGAQFARIAENEVARLRTLAETYPDAAILGLASIAAAAYADAGRVFADRRSAIRYLAINASAKLEDYWSEDDSLWKRAGNRRVQLSDMAAELKEQMLADQVAIAESTVTEEDLACYSEEQIKLYAFSPDKFLLSGKTRHMAVCGSCQERIARWMDHVRKAEERLMSERGGRLPEA